MKISCYILRLLLIVGLIPVVSAPVFSSNFLGTLHAVLVTQDDVEIGTPYSTLRFEQEVAKIAYQTYLKLNFYHFSHQDTQQIQTINELTVGSNDVILFCYIGHGHGKVDGWPAYYTNSIPSYLLHLPELHEQLLKKKARLTLTLFDCCNHVETVEEEFLPEVPPLAFAPSPLSAYHYLFNLSKGDIMLSSASKGQYSYSTALLGGFFSYAFFEVLAHMPITITSRPQQLWDELLTKTQDKIDELCSTHQGITPQTIQYRNQTRAASFTSYYELFVPSQPGRSKGIPIELFKNRGCFNQLHE